MRLTEQEQRADFELLSRTIRSIDLEAEVYEKGDLFPEMGLLVIYPDESETARRENVGKSQEEQDNFLAAVSYMFELDEEEDQLNKYILIFSEMNRIYNDIDELTLYRKLTEYNKEVAMGYFYAERDEAGDMKVNYKHTMHSKAGAPIDADAYGELIIQLIYYVSILTDQLEKLRK